MTKRINEDNIFAVIVFGSLLLLAILVVVGFTFYSTKTGLGILVGGMIAIMNFLWMRNVLQRILISQPAKPTVYSQLRFIARISVTGILLYAIMVSGWVSLAGLLVGLSVIVANIIAISIIRALGTGG
ncbi:MAG: hypothetical protein CXR30_03620 [Geobacter sp.]|nr:MAG: hypothetical protein CXR30_03620 [Geobacter sp.]